MSVLLADHEQVAAVGHTEKTAREAGLWATINVCDPPDDPAAVRLLYLTDPDGNRIELVQWPPGHADGITAADQP